MSAAPHPLRVLLAWPEPAATDLWRGLQAQGPQVDVTRAPAAELADYLQVAGYYHVLHVTPEHWRGLPPRQRARFAGRVCLVVLGPGPAAASDAEGAASCLYLPANQPAAEGVALYLAFHRSLSEDWRVSEVAADSGGRLVLAGGEPAWPAAGAQYQPARGRQVNAVDASGGAVAIGPGAKATKIAAGGTYIERQTVTSASGVAVGQIVVLGDAVSGDKVVHHAAGDQVNINRGAPAAGKLEQNAAGDQVNVNRTGGAPTSASSAAKTCPTCGEPVQPGHRFCQGCGRQVDGKE